MIGVIAAAHDLAVVREFFELFKTAWEPVASGRRYAAVLCTDDAGLDVEADVVVIYSALSLKVDRQCGVAVEAAEGADLEWGHDRIPIYGRLARFVASGSAALRVSGQPAEYAADANGTPVRRLGYELFREVELLLTVGQPPSSAPVPTLELHIGVLRQTLLEAGVPFLEVPPRPFGYDFTCCLTHDVDFFGIRRHRFDHTVAGFMVRATVGSVLGALRGRRHLADVVDNFRAVCRLPFVYLGLARDFWDPFRDYAQVEDPAQATFFMVPVKGRAGVAPNGASDGRRAVAYEIGDVAPQVRVSMSRGSEIAVHGIDAWRDAAAGRAELAELTAVTGQQASGIRMHWLYFSEDSPANLEAGGFDYDSTWGYNDAVGYRAGTSQVFQLVGTHRLLELPLSIMDSALFSSERQALTEGEAMEKCREIVANARRFGGTVVVNWHCRSLAPERLWRRPYRALLAELETGSRVWFARASEAVEWFRWRRSIRFSEIVRGNSTTVRVAAAGSSTHGAILRIYQERGGQPSANEQCFNGGANAVVDVPMAHRIMQSHASACRTSLL